LECEYCQAEVWYEERAEKTKTLKKVDFSLCCQKGNSTSTLTTTTFSASKFAKWF